MTPAVLDYQRLRQRSDEPLNIARAQDSSSAAALRDWPVPNPRLCGIRSPFWHRNISSERKPVQHEGTEC